jgi:hypothetical protein
MELKRAHGLLDIKYIYRRSEPELGCQYAERDLILGTSRLGPNVEDGSM